jgi:hypothetical protein
MPRAAPRRLCGRRSAQTLCLRDLWRLRRVVRVDLVDAATSPANSVKSGLRKIEVEGAGTVRAKKRTERRVASKAKRKLSFAAGVGLALRRAAKEARRVARMHGTPIYVWENGRVVAKKP